MKRMLLMCVMFLSSLCVSLFAKNGVYFSGSVIVDQKIYVPKVWGSEEWNTSSKRDSPGVQVNAGYNHDFTELFGLGVETALSYYKKVTYAFDSFSSSLTIRTFEAVGVPVIHLKQFDLYFRIGGLRQKLIFSKPFDLYSKTLIAPILSVGIGYQIDNHFSIGFFYSRIFGKKMGNITEVKEHHKKPSVDAYMFYLRYTFP